MRKRGLLSFLFGLVLAGIGLLVNYLSFKSAKKLIFAFGKTVDGIMRLSGFGWKLAQTSVLVEGETYAGVELTFSFPTFMLYAVVLGAVFFLVFTLFGAFKDKN